MQFYSTKGSTTIAYAECYDADSNEWYDASPMNLNRSALSACVIAGLANAREYSYHGKARDLGQGYLQLPAIHVVSNKRRKLSNVCVNARTN